MYLYIGEDTLVSISEMIAIISIKRDKRLSKRNLLFLNKRTEEGDVITLNSLENAKKMVVLKNNLVYLSSIAPRPIFKGTRKNELSEGMK